LQAITLLTDLWQDEATVLSNIGPLPDGSDFRDCFYDALKSALTHPDKVFKVTVFGATFALLDRLLEIKSNYSPIIFKTLVEATVDLLSSGGKRDRLTEEFILKNFIGLFEQYVDLPVGLLADPVIKVFGERLKKNQNKPGYLTTEEINFLI
jgi:hypothetical protein